MKINVCDNTFKWKDGHPGRTGFVEFEVGEKFLYTNHSMVSVVCKWRIEKGGYRANIRKFIESAGDEYSFHFLEGSHQFGFVGDQYERMDIVTIYQENI